MDFSFAEFAIIGIVALLVIGPDKLPGLARTAGLWVGKVRNFVNSVKTEIDAELKMEDIRNAVKGGKSELHEISELISDTRSDFQNSINTISSKAELDNKDLNSLQDESEFQSEEKPAYQVKAIPEQIENSGDDEDDTAHNEVEDDFVDDYNSDYEISEIEPTSKDEADSESNPDSSVVDSNSTEQKQSSKNSNKHNKQGIKN